MRNILIMRRKFIVTYGKVISFFGVLHHFDCIIELYKCYYNYILHYQSD